MCDYISGHFWTVQKDGTDWKIDKKPTVKKNISTFGEDAFGEIYAAEFDYAKQDEGIIYKIEGEAGEEIKITEQPKSTKICENASGELSLKVSVLTSLINGMKMVNLFPAPLITFIK